jgi:hypothetical protein
MTRLRSSRLVLDACRQDATGHALIPCFDDVAIHEVTSEQVELCTQKRIPEAIQARPRGGAEMSADAHPERLHQVSLPRFAVQAAGNARAPDRRSTSAAIDAPDWPMSRLRVRGLGRGAGLLVQPTRLQLRSPKASGERGRPGHGDRRRRRAAREPRARSRPLDRQGRAPTAGLHPR